MFSVVVLSVKNEFLYLGLDHFVTVLLVTNKTKTRQTKKYLNSNYAKMNGGQPLIYDTFNIETFGSKNMVPGFLIISIFGRTFIGHFKFNSTSNV